MCTHVRAGTPDIKQCQHRNIKASLGTDRTENSIESSQPITLSSSLLSFQTGKILAGVFSHSCLKRSIDWRWNRSPASSFSKAWAGSFIYRQTLNQSSLVHAKHVSVEIHWVKCLRQVVLSEIEKAVCDCSHDTFAAVQVSVRAFLHWTMGSLLKTSEVVLEERITCRAATKFLLWSWSLSSCSVWQWVQPVTTD